jgi:hypothetical protein
MNGVEKQVLKEIEYVLDNIVESTLENQETANQKEFQKGYEKYINQIPIELKKFAFLFKKNSEVTGPGPYEIFIWQCMGEDPKIKMASKPPPHSHHIIPFFEWKKSLETLEPSKDQYNKSKNVLSHLIDHPLNLVLLTPEQHRTAHKLRYQQYGSILDQASLALLEGKFSELQAIIAPLGGKATAEKNKKLSLGFWNSEIQKRLSDKALMRPDIKEIRSEAGKKGNKIGKAIGGKNALSTEQRKAIGEASGKKTQANKIINCKHKILLYYKDNPYLCCTNCTTGGEICKIINMAIKHIPEASELRRTTVILQDAMDRFTNGSKTYKSRNGKTIKRLSTNGWSADIIGDS